MLHEKSPRAIFGVIAIILLVSAPLVILFIPMVQLSTFRYDPQNLLMLPPMVNYYLLTLASAFIIAIFIGLAIKRTRAMYFLASLLAIAAIVATYFSSLSHIQIHPEYVQIKNFHTVSTYPMDDMDTIIYEYGIEERGRYLFITQGEEIEVTDSPMMTDEKRRQLNRIAREQDVAFVERAMEVTKQKE
ncbi:hypothetical protein ACFO0S_14640 [Chryseomicrobium palamuruense]|uniref:DUF5673 domain-containing protein n=1 Tax=Chryseomicrobium palamuruense TaxID=682973 RepID=A0ABV8V084_9BACL